MDRRVDCGEDGGICKSIVQKKLRFNEESGRDIESG